MMRICIDPGHGGTDPGAVAGNTRESQVNLGISLRLAELLKQHGHEITMTRHKDVPVGLWSRARIANHWEPDIFVSVHANAASPQAAGFEVFHYVGSGRGAVLAEGIVAGLAAMWPDRRNRGVKEGRFLVLKATKMPAALVEVGFLTNAEERALITSPTGQRMTAEAIANGIDIYSEVHT